MKKVEVFGTGCKKCTATEELLQKHATELGVEIELQHISDPVEIASRGVTTTPAVMVDGKLVHKGGLPSKSEIEAWLR